jgi:class 3 adenylate cyclase
MSQKRFWSDLQRFLWVTPIPLIWIAIEAFGWLTPLEHISVDWRFRVRGPLESKAKVWYVNRDVDTSALIGEDYISRARYAEAAEALLEIGKAKAVFLDFILSDVTGKSESLDQDRFIRGNLILAETLERHPGKIVLAAAYSGIQHPFSSQQSVMPYVDEDSRARFGNYDPATNPLPELPQFPFWAPELPDQGYFTRFPSSSRVGLINISVHLNQGPAPRYAPAFAEIDNRQPAYFLANGIRNWFEQIDRERYETELIQSDEGEDLAFDIFSPKRAFSVPTRLAITFHTVALEMFLAAHPDVSLEWDAEELRLLNVDGAVLTAIPLVEQQMIAVNYYSGWINDFGEKSEFNRSLQSEENRLDAEAKADDPAAEFKFFTSRDIWKDPQAWVDALESEHSREYYRATGWMSTWSRGFDPYNPKVSLVDVIAVARAHAVAVERGAVRAKAFIERTFETFADAYVLIGPTDPNLQDLAPTPFDSQPAPKVTVHGNLLKTITDGLYLRYPPEWFLITAVVVLTILVAVLSITGGVQSRANKLGALFAILIYIGFSFLLFRQFHWVLPLVTPVAAALTTGMAVTLAQLIFEEKQRSRIKNLFGTYVSPELVNRMVESHEEPQLGGHEAQITAFFSDIQSFSSFSEVLEAGQLVDLMNEYLDAMTVTLGSERGTLDKYIGDAIVGIFGAPIALNDHAARACRAALRIQQRQAELRDKWRGEARAWPEIVHHMRTRIGLNSGTAVVGNMGSSIRFNYTMMGDMVNLAARNESGAKSYGVYTMVSEDTMRGAIEGNADEFTFRYLDKIVVKGRTQPVSVYELVGFTREIEPSVRDCLAIYAEAIEHYLARRWDDALKAFAAAAAKEPHQPSTQTYIATNPSLVMISRARLMKENPPSDDWDGRYVMTTK